MIPPLGIRKKLMLALIAMLVPLAVFTGITIYNEQRIHHDIARFMHEHDEIQLVSSLQLTTAKSLMPANDYIITGSMEYFEDFNKASAEMERLLAQARVTLPTHGDFPENADELIIKTELTQYWESIKAASLKIFKIKNPVGDKTAVSLMKGLDYEYGYPMVEKLAYWQTLEQLHMRDAEADLTTITHRAYTGTLLSSLAVALIGVFFAVIYSKRFTSTIKKLDNEATAIAKGDFKRKIALDTKDEFSSLASSINFMTSELEKSYSQLEEKIAERTKELAKSEEKYRQIIELSSEHIWTLDTSGNITFINKRTENALNYTLDELVGKSYQPLIPINDLPVVEAAMQKALNGEEATYETTVLKKNGEIYSIIATITPIKNNGIITGVLGFSRDITAIKSAEEKLAERVNELERFRKATLQREVRMKELRDKIKALEQALKTSMLGA